MVERNNGELLISITDTGIGMSDKEVIAIFEPFQQTGNRMSRKH